MNCALCSRSIPETFLKKLVGTYVKDAKGKRHAVCFACQKALGSREALLEKL